MFRMWQRFITERHKKQKIMAKKIKLELTEFQMKALIDVVDSASAVFEECEITQKDIKTIDRMLKKNGYKRLHL